MIWSSSESAAGVWQGLWWIGLVGENAQKLQPCYCLVVEGVVLVFENMMRNKIFDDIAVRNVFENYRRGVLHGLLQDDMGQRGCFCSEKFKTQR